MLAMLERFFQFCHQFIGNLTKNENFTYFIENFDEYNWRKSFELHFQHRLTLKKEKNNIDISLQRKRKS